MATTLCDLLPRDENRSSDNLLGKFLDYVGPALDALDQTTLDFAGQSSGASTSQIATRIQRTPRATRDRLNRLVSLRLLAAVGSSPRDPRRVFHRLRE